MAYRQIDHRHIALEPLAARESKFALDEILIEPNAAAPNPGPMAKSIQHLAERIHAARLQGAAVVLAYGAHLIKNGLGPVVERMLEAGWVTHLATNGAGTIHDWEYAFQGRSEEDVGANVARGCFGTWDETGRYLHLAVLVGALQGMGYGESVGKFICDDGCNIPTRRELTAALGAWASAPTDAPTLPAYAELLQAMVRFAIPPGPCRVVHPHKTASLTAAAYRHRIPLTVHPGIGYDIIYNHHMANGAALGRGSDIDYRVFAESVRHLDGGVFLSVGSAVMAPQVFEKAVSLANNLRRQQGGKVVRPYIFVNDLAPIDWDWSEGEPPKDNPAYYLRFCKSFSRMGGEMTYIGGDNKNLLHNLYHTLNSL